MLYELARLLMLDLILQWENDFNITAVIYQIYFPTPPREKSVHPVGEQQFQQSTLMYNLNIFTNLCYSNKNLNYNDELKINE